MKKLALLLPLAATLCANAQVPMPPEAVWVDPQTGVANGTVIFNRSEGNQQGWRLFDGIITNAFDTVNKWCVTSLSSYSTFLGGNLGNPAWTVYQFANDDKWAITNYSLHAANDGGNESGRDPMVWWLEGSTNLPNNLVSGNGNLATDAVNAATWHIVDAQTNSVARPWGAFNFSTGTFDCSHNNTAYNAYRLRVFTTWGGILSLSEWRMTGHSGSMGGDFNVLSGVDAENVDYYSADLPFYLEVNNGGPVQLWLDYGPGPDAMTNSVAAGSFTETTNSFTHLAGLMPVTTYYWRHRAVFNGVEVTNRVDRVFSTLGAVTFPKVFAYNNGTSTLNFDCAVKHDGAAVTTVTLWAGTDPDDMGFVDSWVVEPSDTCRGVIPNCALGRMYWFRFTATYTFGGKPYAFDTGLRQFRPLAMEDIKVLYWGGGSADILPGTPLPFTPGPLGGVWNKTAKNWAVDEFGNGYVAWTDGDDKTAVFSSFNAGDTMVVVTLATNVMLNKISAPFNQLPPGATSARYIVNNASASHTITLAGEKPEIFIADPAHPGIHNAQYFHVGTGTSLIAANGFEQTGRGRLEFIGPSPGVYGKVTIKGNNGSSLWMNEANSALNNVDEFHFANHVNQFGLRLRLYASPNPANNRIKDTAIVRLNGLGIVNLNAASGTTEFIGPLVLDSSGWIRLIGEGGADLGVFTFADIQRGPYNRGTLLVEGYGGDGGFFTKAAVSEEQSSLPSGKMIPWIHTKQARPVRLNTGTRNMEPMTELVPAPADLSTWIGGTNYFASAGFAPVAGTAIPTVTVDSLGVFVNNATTFTIGAADTLTVDTGHLAFGHNGADTTFAGGNITSGSGCLYLLTDETDNPARHVSFHSALTGDMDVVKSGGWNVHFTGSSSNTYSGTTYVHFGRLRMSKSGGAPSIPGDLVVSRGGFADMETAWQLSPNTRVTLREGGTLRGTNGEPKANFMKPMVIENGTFEFAGSDKPLPHYTLSAPGYGLVFANGGRVYHNFPHNTAPMRFSLQTDVLVSAASSNQAFITTPQPLGWNPTANVGFSQSLTLSEVGMAGVVRTFDVRDAIGLKPGVPELVVNMPLSTADYVPVTLVKAGGGIMALEQFSGRFRGEISVTNGTLWLNGPYATQAVLHASLNGNSVTGLASTAGLHAHQPTNLLNTNHWIGVITGPSTLTGAPSTGNVSGFVYFYACGSAGRADVTVSDFGTLGGTGGTGGSVFVNEGGTFRPGTFAEPGGVFKIGNDLKFTNGGAWHVDVLDTKTCNSARVAGDVWLGGSVVPEFFKSARRPKGTWVIAKYEGEAHGKMSAPQGCSVRVDEVKKEILLCSGEAGTLLLVR